MKSLLHWQAPFFDALTVLLKTQHIADFHQCLNLFLTLPGKDAGRCNSWKGLGFDGEKEEGTFFSWDKLRDKVACSGSFRALLFFWLDKHARERLEI